MRSYFKKINNDGPLSLWLLSLPIFFLFFFIIKKALFIPVTHDEVSTISYFAKLNVWAIISYQDPIPNNHILNTLLIKFFIGIFGESPFIARLPNVLSFVLYFLVVLKIAKELLQDNFVRVAAIALFTLNPYLVDFFSLARGYALSVALETTSIWFFLLTINKFHYRNSILALSFGALAVYANFTLLNYFLPLSVLLLVSAYQQLRQVDEARFKKVVVTVLAFVVGLIAVIWVPISKMLATNQFAFWHDSGFYQETIHGVLFSSKYNVPYFDWNSDSMILSTTLIVGFVLTLFFIIQRNITKIQAFSFLLLAGTVAYNILQFQILDVPYLNSRTSLFFLPLVILPFALSLQRVVEYHRIAGLLLAIFFSVLPLQHFVRGYRVTSAFEWYYDQNTYEVLDTLKEIYTNEHRSSPIVLDCCWLFHPSLTYHSEHQYPGIAKLEPYHKDAVLDTKAEYYYIPNEEWEMYKDKFEVIKEYTWGSRKLIRRKK